MDCTRRFLFVFGQVRAEGKYRGLSAVGERCGCSPRSGDDVSLDCEEGGGLKVVAFRVKFAEWVWGTAVELRSMPTHAIKPHEWGTQIFPQLV
jgi:hypothetical protein